MAESTPRIALQVLEIPTSLVLVGKSYKIFLQIQNNSQVMGKFKISYEGSGLQVKSSDLANKELTLSPNSSEIDRVELTPIQKGIISLNLKIAHFKEVIKEVRRTVQTPSPPSVIDSSMKTTPPSSSDKSSVFDKGFSSDISETLKEIFEKPEAINPPTESSLQSPTLESQQIVEKTKAILEEEIFSTPIYLNAIDKESTKILKEFAKKGDSNILSSEMGLPLCICYFYSEDQSSKWKIRPALIRNLCIRMKEKFGKFSYYLSYPLSKEFDEKEIPIIQEAVQTFVLPQASRSSQMLMLNLDIIPALEKPSIILGFEKSGIYETIKNKLINVFGNSVDILFDDSIFSGGLLYNYLVKWAGPSETRVINIVLSNNFISNMGLFQTLLESLVSLSSGA